MAFMELQIVESTWVRWENTHGEGQMVEADLFTKGQLDRLLIAQNEEARIAVADMLRDYTENGEPDASTVELVCGWCGRYSAPGYMDRTDWCGPFDTEREAREETIARYGEEE